MLLSSPPQRPPVNSQGGNCVEGAAQSSPEGKLWGNNVPERVESQDLEQSGVESVDWILARSQTSSDAGCHGEGTSVCKVLVKL